MTEVPLFGFKDDRPVPIDWKDYAYAISLMINLRLRWSVAVNLLHLSKLQSNPVECQTFAKLWEGVSRREIIVRQQMLAMQTIALTMEVTENFAAMCFAYAKAVKHGPKFLPLLMRDYGHYKIRRYEGSGVDLSLGNATNLFDAMLESWDDLQEYLACKGEPAQGLIEKRKVIKEIVQFRKNYEPWYNKFKHTNSIFSIGALFDVPGELSMVHMVPNDISWHDGKVELPDRDVLKSIKTDESKWLKEKVSHLRTQSFLTAYQNIDDPGRILFLLESFWQPIRKSQHKALFGTEIT